MTFAFPMLPPLAAHAAGWAVAHSLWQCAAVAVIASACLWLARRHSPNARYAICLVGMAACFLWPAVNGAQLYLQAREALATARSEDVLSGSPPPGPASASPISDALVAARGPRAPVVAPSRAHERPVSRPPAVADGLSSSPVSTGLDWIEPYMPWLAQGWFLGVVIMSLWNLGAWTYLQFLRHCGIAPAGERVMRLAAECSARLNMSRSVRWLRSSIADSPGVIGWLRPAVLLPGRVLDCLAESDLVALIAHELAHVRRYDYMMNLLQTVVETLLFYHPAVWWLGRRARVEREYGCDDLALKACRDAGDYPAALARFNELIAAPPVLAAGASGGSLLDRVRRLLGRGDPHLRPPIMRWTGGAAALFMIAACLGGNTVALKAEEVFRVPDPNPRWTITLPERASAELLGVARYAQQAWRPDGTPLGLRADRNEAGPGACVFAVRLNKRKWFNTKIQVEDAVSTAPMEMRVGRVPTPGNKSLMTARALVAMRPDVAATTVTVIHIEPDGKDRQTVFPNVKLPPPVAVTRVQADHSDSGATAVAAGIPGGTTIKLLEVRSNLLQWHTPDGTPMEVNLLTREALDFPYGFDATPAETGYELRFNEVVAVRGAFMANNLSSSGNPTSTSVIWVPRGVKELTFDIEQPGGGWEQLAACELHPEGSRECETSSVLFRIRQHSMPAAVSAAGDYKAVRIVPTEITTVVSRDLQSFQIALTLNGRQSSVISGGAPPMVQDWDFGHTASDPLPLQVALRARPLYLATFRKVSLAPGCITQVEASVRRKPPEVVFAHADAATTMPVPTGLTAGFKCGAWAQLVVVNDHTSDLPRWWLPDGTALEGPPTGFSRYREANYFQPDDRMWWFCVGVPRGVSYSWGITGFKEYSCAGGMANAIWRHWNRTGIDPVTYEVVPWSTRLGTGPKKTKQPKQVSLLFKTSGAAWRSVAVHDAREPWDREEGGVTTRVLFMKPTAWSPIHPRVTMMTLRLRVPWQDRMMADARLLARDNMGIWHLASGPGGGRQDFGFEWKDLRPDRVRLYVLQVRPWECAEFEELSYHPGRKTAPKIRNYSTDVPAPALTPDPCAGVDLPETCVEGVVWTAGEEPVADAVVEIRRGSEDGEVVGRFVTGAGGGYSLRLPPGTYWVSARKGSSSGGTWADAHKYEGGYGAQITLSDPETDEGAVK